MSARAKKDTSEVALIDAQKAPVINEGATILAMMEKIATMPDVPVERLEQMFNLHQRVQGEQARKNYAAAFTKCQAEMTAVVKDGKGDKGHKYATYVQLDTALRPIYTSNGFAVSFNSGESPLPEHVRVLATLSHSDGHEKDYQTDIPCDGKGAKGNDVMTKTHAMGSAFTYGKRYLLLMIFNIALTDKADDDGKAAGARIADAPITEDQVMELIVLMDGVGADKAKFCKFHEIEGLNEIMQSQFEKAKKQILAKAKQKAPDQ